MFVKKHFCRNFRCFFLIPPAESPHRWRTEHILIFSNLRHSDCVSYFTLSMIFVNSSTDNVWLFLINFRKYERNCTFPIKAKHQLCCFNFAISIRGWAAAVIFYKTAVEMTGIGKPPLGGDCFYRRIGVEQ